MYKWEKYSSELYVERAKELEDLLAWANSASVSKQVKSLVAPPGAGKTWFLKAVQEKLERRVSKDAPPERLVIFCDAPTLVDSSSGYPLNTAKIFDWLEKIQKDAVRLCRYVRLVERMVQIAQAIDQLVIDLCERCVLPHPIVILVDGLDEISTDQAAKIEWEILERFIGKPCTRMIIAHRDEYTLKNPLKNRTERFFLSAPLSVDEQFKRFKNRFYASATHLTATNLAEFKCSLKHYQWNHPYVNAFLFDKALARISISDVTRLLTAEDLRECLYAVIERRDDKGNPRFGELKAETFECLKRIASDLPNDWSLTDLLKQLGLREQDECMKQLFEYGVAFYNPTIRRYQLADGLRELARDLVERGG